MGAIETLGFIGLGVMGEPMCENLARKSQRPVCATDLRRMPLSRLEAAGVNACGSVAEVAESAPLAIISTRATLRDKLADTVEAQTRHELREQTWLMKTEDHREGVKAVAERRPGRFSGK